MLEGRIMSGVEDVGSSILVLRMRSVIRDSANWLLTQPDGLELVNLFRRNEGLG